MTDIIERLRDKAFIGGPTMDAAHTKRIEWEAADEITRLREENVRLRAALKPFAGVADRWIGQQNREVLVMLEDCFTAAAAIRET